MAKELQDEMVLSHYRVRTALGILGMALPLVLLIGGLQQNHRIEPSISDFYHTTYRDVFVGTLCAIGVFMISYRGHPMNGDRFINDDWLATIAGVSAFGVALFPNESPTQQIATVTQSLFGIGTSPLFHYASALVFFSCLAGFCLVKFSRTERHFRRLIYKGCGYVIVVALIGISVASYYKIAGGPVARAIVVDNTLVFWFEAIGIWAFGLSWLVKGQADIGLARMAGLIKASDDPVIESEEALE